MSVFIDTSALGKFRVKFPHCAATVKSENQVAPLAKQAETFEQRRYNTSLLGVR